MHEDKLIEIIEENLKIQKKYADASLPGELDKKWAFLTKEQPHRFINKDLSINRDAIRDFRRLQIFIPDLPSEFKFSSNPLRRLISLGIYLFRGSNRGTSRLLKEYYEILKNSGCESLLRKYPVFKLGNPKFFKYQGCEFTVRWCKHIYSLGLFNRILGEKIKSDFISLDIGSSYGIFSSLLKKEYPQSRHVLLDFPEQLVLAHYYLGMLFPDARIAGYKEIQEVKSINRDFFKNYDFVLIPWFEYKNIQKDSLDMVTNFASFGEMRREWFDFYVRSEPFLSCEYFFTHNRFQSYPEYDTDLTILDYPLQDFDKFYFGICPTHFHSYKEKFLFFYEKLVISSQYFDFIGRRK